MEKKCGLLGATLRHSYSKLIHKNFGDYEYGLYGVSPEEAEEKMRDGSFMGLNVTIPYKELAYSVCDERDPAAERAKSVNTVVHRGGKILGYNTDVFGFIGMVRRAGIELCGKKVLILGSGGTSKTAHAAAQELRAEKILTVSRSGKLNYENVYEEDDAQVIINTTPVGMYPKNGAVPIDISRFPKLEGVVDVIYNPAKTKLLFDAERLGIRHTNGLYMLAAQGFRAAEIFLGHELPSELIEKAERDVRAETMNIVLIGMPGSGKSEIGKRLSERLSRALIDTDAEIEKNFAKPAEIIENKGEDVFRGTESETARRVGAESGKIISTGGGIVLREENLESLSQNGKIYLIERDLGLLEVSGRPLSRDVGALYEARRDKYLKFADVRIDNNGDIDDAVGEIVRDFFGK